MKTRGSPNPRLSKNLLSCCVTMVTTRRRLACFTSYGDCSIVIKDQRTAPPPWPSATWLSPRRPATTRTLIAAPAKRSWQILAIRLILSWPTPWPGPAAFGRMGPQIRKKLSDWPILRAQVTRQTSPICIAWGRSSTELVDLTRLAKPFEDRIKKSPSHSHVSDGLLLAMIHHRLGRSKEAQQWLTKSIQEMEQAGSARDSGDAARHANSPPDRLEQRLLLAEAKALIGETE